MIDGSGIRNRHRNEHRIPGVLVGDDAGLVAFALGLMLFGVTLALNVVALHIVRKYREQYE